MRVFSACSSDRSSPNFITSPNSLMKLVYSSVVWCSHMCLNSDLGSCPSFCRQSESGSFVSGVNAVACLRSSCSTCSLPPSCCLLASRGSYSIRLHPTAAFDAVILDTSAPRRNSSSCAPSARTSRMAHGLQISSGCVLNR